MAHFAEVDASGVVTRVVVVANSVLLDNGTESEQRGIEFLQSLYGNTTWKQTSYNGNRRKNYAGVGYTYDSARDAFIPPKPFQSWVLEETSCQWRPPVPMPQGDHRYRWDESAGQWIPV